MPETTSATSVSVTEADHIRTEIRTEVRAEQNTEVDAEAAETRTLGALPVEPHTEPRMNPIAVRPIGLPGETETIPRHGRMLLLSVWTSVLVLLGLVAGARIFAAVLFNSGPGWLVPVCTGIGAAGVIAAGAAFASINRAFWAFTALGVSTGALALNLGLLVIFL